MRKNPRSRSPLRRFIGALGYFSFLSVALLTGTVVGWLGQTKQSAALVKQVFRPTPPENVFERDSVTLLLLGCDEDRYYGGTQILRNRARADMILVARLDFKNERITGVSIPRDTECRLPGYSSHKINAYYAMGDSEAESEGLMRQAVTHLLPGVEVDRVVTLDYAAFQRAIDLIGGVTVPIEDDMCYDDNAGGLHVNLKRGRQTLDGYEAMGFVRYRKGNPGRNGCKSLSDFERQENQKRLLVAIKQQALQNWTLLPRLAQEGRAVLNEALSEDEIASVAFFAKDLKPSSIIMGQIPIIERRGTTRLRVDEARLPATLAQYQLVDQPRITVAR